MNVLLGSTNVLYMTYAIILMGLTIVHVSQFETAQIFNYENYQVLKFIAFVDLM